MNEEKNDLNEVYRSTSIIGYSTSFSVIIYGLIAYYLLSRSSGGQSAVENSEMIRQIFWFVGISILFSVSLMRRLISKNAKKKEISSREMLKQLQTTSMVTFGMCESIGILGLVLSIMTKNINDYYGLGFLSLVSFGLFFPKIDLWEEQMNCTTDTDVEFDK